MKVLFVTRKFPPQTGGMERFSWNLIEKSKKLLGQENIDTITLSRSQKHLVWFLPLICIRLILFSWKYDAIHLGDGLLAGAAWPAKWLYSILRTRPRYFATLHGLDITYRNPLYQFYFTLFCRSLDRYISVSQYTDNLAAHAGIERRCVIPNGVDENLFSRGHISVLRPSAHLKKMLDIPEDHKILITVGRLIERKGLEWFITQVFSRLHSNCTYLIIGQGPLQQRVESSILLLNQEVQNRIHMLGRVDQNKMDIFLQGADIFIMPNIRVEGDVEGFGLVALEASMAGLYVIAADIEGIRDAIHQGRNGVRLPSGDPKAWIGTINGYLHNPSVVDAKRQTYADYTRRHFSWDTVARRYISEMRCERQSPTGRNRVPFASSVEGKH